MLAVFAPYHGFQSTCPARGTTLLLHIIKRILAGFQSTCPARGTTYGMDNATAFAEISIHVPREGHDKFLRFLLQGRREFQSTCPARGTTNGTWYAWITRVFQSTCPARGTTREMRRGLLDNLISIHVPREGHDDKLPLIALNSLISIHVPREGHDYPRREGGGRTFYFNPRAPRGARHDYFTSCLPSPQFQSTCPARGTTSPSSPMFIVIVISIHVPREGHDGQGRDLQSTNVISIHVPREGHDGIAKYSRVNGARFQSTCPARGTTWHRIHNASKRIFQSTCPARGTTRV